MESPGNELAYWQEVARLRAEQVAGLTSGHRLMFTRATVELEALGEPENFKPRGPNAFQRQQLRDALTALTRIVETILEQ